MEEAFAAYQPSTSSNRSWRPSTPTAHQSHVSILTWYVGQGLEGKLFSIPCYRGLCLSFRLISIMLGRLDMGVDQCIDAYRKLSKRVLCSDTRLPGIKTMCRSSNAARLEQVLGDMLKQQGYDERTPFRDVDTPCRV